MTKAAIMVKTSRDSIRQKILALYLTTMFVFAGAERVHGNEVDRGAPSWERSSSLLVPLAASFTGLWLWNLCTAQSRGAAVVHNARPLTQRESLDLIAKCAQEHADRPREGLCRRFSGVFLFAFAYALIDPLMQSFQPFFSRLLTPWLPFFFKPELLQGESSWTYLIREKWGVCQPESKGSWRLTLLESGLFQVCGEREQVISRGDLVFPKDTSRSVEEALRALTRARKLGRGLPNILLYGPAGTGKTSLAKAIAQKMNFNFQKVSGNQITENGGQASLREALQWAERKAVNWRMFADERPVLLFMDEVEYFARSREAEDLQGVEYQAISEFLAQINDSGSRFYMLVAATNLPDSLTLDEAFVARFDRYINVSLPQLEDREKLFRLNLEKNRGQTPLLYEELLASAKAFAKQSQGFSGRDIAAVCRNAVMGADGEASIEDVNRAIQDRAKKPRS